MINFEEELKRFQPMPEINQTEEAIYNNDLKDISDIVAQVVGEVEKAHETAMGTKPGIIRR